MNEPEFFRGFDKKIPGPFNLLKMIWGFPDFSTDMCLSLSTGQTFSYFQAGLLTLGSS